MLHSLSWFQFPVFNCKSKVTITFYQIIGSLGHIERRYIEVPHGASWVEATMKASGFDTARRFFVDAVQV